MPPIALATSLIAIIALPAIAQEHSRVTLLPGQMMEDGRYLAGVRIALAPGWKTYWRAPGTGGIPPRFDWSGSSNVTDAQTLWPTPTVFETYGLRSVGYVDEVVFPVLFTTEDTGAPIDLDLTLDYGVCADICIPASATVTGRIDPTAALGTPGLNAAMDARARDAAAHGITASCTLSPGEGAGIWQISATISGHAFASPPPAVIEIPNPDLWIHVPVATGADPLELTAGMDWFGAGAFSAARSDIRITLLPAGERAIDITGC